MQYAEIAVNTKTSLGRQFFTYKIKPEQLPYVKRGVLVLVPFHGKKKEGIVLTLKQHSNIAIEQKLKFINKIVDTEPIITKYQIELAKKISEYYLAPIGEVLFIMTPSIAKRQTSKELPALEMRNNSKNFIV